MFAMAKLFMHGRSQAVRLPKEFRLPGKEVRVSRIGEKVILEPVVKAADFDPAAFWSKIDALRGDVPDMEIPEDKPAPQDARRYIHE